MVINYLKVNEIVQSISETPTSMQDKLYAINTSDVVDGKLLTPPLIKCENLKGQFKKGIKKNDILFSEIRPVNAHFALIDLERTYNYVASTKLMVLRKFNDDVDLLYFYYWLTNKKMLNILQSRAENRICSFPQITFELLGDYKVPVPNKNIQRKIASTLKAIDNKIENNNAINAELEAMAKTLYDYWFLQFEFPNEEGKPYKSSGGAMVWNEELKREIPEGWETKALANLCEIRLGGTPNTKIKEYWNGNINWLNSGEVAISPIIQSEKTITEKAKNETSTSYAEVGDVLMSITRYIRPSILGINACYNQSVIAIIANSTYKTSFIYPFLLSQVDRYMTLRTGAQQPHINKEVVENTPVVKPVISVLNSYYKEAENIYRLQINIAKQNQELASLRDFLLPLLMNGQVGFKDSAPK